MIQLAIRLGFLAFLVYWSFIIVSPFIPILAWSVVLTVALYPPYDWLSAHLGNRPKLAAVILTVINLAIVIGPVTWLGLGLAEGLGSVSDQIASGRLTIPSPPDSVSNWPIVGTPLYELWKQASINLQSAFFEVAPQLKPLASSVLDIARGAGVGTLKFLIAVALAGFLFPAAPQLVATAKSILDRIVPQRSEDFVALAGATIRTVSQGVIGIAVFQSLLIGLGLKLAGVPGASALAVATLVLGILQIGASIVLIPVIIWIWTAKSFAIALLSTIYLVVVGLSDNVLKPMLMGRGLTTPMLVIFIGVLGGTLAHGILGLFVGPIVLAVGWELMMAWIRDDQARAVSYDTDKAIAERR